MFRRPPSDLLFFGKSVKGRQYEGSEVLLSISRVLDVVLVTPDRRVGTGRRQVGVEDFG